MKDKPTCSCPSYRFTARSKGKLCKHQLFILTRVMHYSSHEDIITKSYFKKEQIDDMFERIRNPEDYAEAIVDASKLDSKAGVDAKPIGDDECAICFDSLNSQELLTHCTAQCGRSFHLKCFEVWEKNKHPVTCPLCRQPWKKLGAPTGKIGKEGYVNYAQELGLREKRYIPVAERGADYIA